MKTNKTAEISLSKKIIEIKQGDIIIHTMAYFVEEDVKEAVQKILERIKCLDEVKRESYSFTEDGSLIFREDIEKIIKSEMGRGLTE